MAFPDSFQRMTYLVASRKLNGKHGKHHQKKKEIFEGLSSLSVVFSVFSVALCEPAPAVSNFPPVLVSDNDIFSRLTKTQRKTRKTLTKKERNF